jgi:hypothetical protein
MALKKLTHHPLLGRVLELMVVPEPLLNRRLIASEPCTEDESEDGLPLREYHRREMSEDVLLDRTSDGLKDIAHKGEKRNYL